MTDLKESAIFADLEKLSTAIQEDKSGERTRNLIAYFARAAASSKDGVKPDQLDEYRMASQMAEGMNAAQRIVRHAWETQHNAKLA